MNKYKGVKVFWNGSPLRDVYPHATKFQVFMYRVRVFLLRCFVVGLLVGAIYGAFVAGGIYNPAVIYTKAEVIKEVEREAHIMEKIAKCESPTGHYDKTGQVTLRGNTNKTVDVGMYQINSVWFKKANELGYDITKPEDNKKMAYFIYSNHGTEPWYSSKACWSK